MLMKVIFQKHFLQNVMALFIFFHWKLELKEARFWWNNYLNLTSFIITEDLESWCQDTVSEKSNCDWIKSSCAGLCRTTLVHQQNVVSSPDSDSTVTGSPAIASSVECVHLVWKCLMSIQDVFTLKVVVEVPGIC